MLADPSPNHIHQTLIPLNNRGIAYSSSPSNNDELHDTSSNSRSSQVLDAPISLQRLSCGRNTSTALMPDDPCQPTCNTQHHSTITHTRRLSTESPDSEQLDSAEMSSLLDITDLVMMPSQCSSTNVNSSTTCLKDGPISIFAVAPEYFTGYEKRRRV